MASSPRLAYVFERFPTFTQTFCAREILELRAQSFPVHTCSIRFPSDEPSQSFPPELAASTAYLPDDETLVREAKRLQSERKLPRPMRRTLESWTSKLDKHRVYAAAWLGPRLRKSGIRHVHVHFAGIAARTAYWLKMFYGIRYSFTGHANDIFCEEENLPVTLEDLIREAAFVVTVSDYSKRALQERFPAHTSKIHRVYNGIDTRAWNPGPGTASPPRIISVGRYIEKKGFADLIDACALLKKDGLAFQCDIIGEGPLGATLQEQVDRLGLNDQVTLAGPMAQDQIRTALEECCVFCLPCVEEKDGGKDNLPTVIMEAMACGLPTVSTPVAGVPEMVLPGKTGLLVPPHSPAELAAALKKICLDPAKRTAFGQAARNLAETTFDIRVTTRHLKHLFVSEGRVRPSWSAINADRLLLQSWLKHFITLVKAN